MPNRWNPGCFCCGQPCPCDVADGSKTFDLLDGDLYAPTCSLRDLSSVITLDFTAWACGFESGLNGSGGTDWYRIEMERTLGGFCDTYAVAAYILFANTYISGFTYPPGLDVTDLPTGNDSRVYLRIFNDFTLETFGEIFYERSAGATTCSGHDGQYTYLSSSFDSFVQPTHTWSSWTPAVA